jgi:hypothetical protein
MNENSLITYIAPDLIMSVQELYIYIYKYTQDHTNAIHHLNEPTHFLTEPAWPIDPTRSLHDLAILLQCPIILLQCSIIFL